MKSVYVPSINRITEKALITSETPAAIISEAISEVPEGSQLLLPIIASHTGNIRKVRNIQLLKLPTSLADVYVQGRFRITAGGENWLVNDSGQDDGERILIFAAPSSMQKLGSSKLTALLKHVRTPFTKYIHFSILCILFKVF